MSRGKRTSLGKSGCSLDYMSKVSDPDLYGVRQALREEERRSQKRDKDGRLNSKIYYLDKSFNADTNLGGLSQNLVIGDIPLLINNRPKHLCPYVMGKPYRP
jgi:hypothetical protein